MLLHITKLVVVLHIITGGKCFSKLLSNLVFSVGGFETMCPIGKTSEPIYHFFDELANMVMIFYFH